MCDKIVFWLHLFPNIKERRITFIRAWIRWICILHGKWDLFGDFQTFIGITVQKKSCVASEAMQWGCVTSHMMNGLKVLRKLLPCGLLFYKFFFVYPSMVPKNCRVKSVKSIFGTYHYDTIVHFNSAIRYLQEQESAILFFVRLQLHRKLQKEVIDEDTDA